MSVGKIQFTIQVTNAVPVTVLETADVNPVYNLVLPPGSGVWRFTLRVDQHEGHHRDDQRQPAQENDRDTNHAQTSPEGFG